jgi:alpha-L-fucosidase
MKITRRTMMETVLGGVAASAIGTRHAAAAGAPVPPYLKEYAAAYGANPRAAATQWFKEAKFGLFMHYGLYSILARGEWVMLQEKIHVAEYEKLKEQFNPVNFDADFITDLALAAGMKYVNITSRHHDSFCLFRTKETNFNSVESPAKRDLIEELAEACLKKGLGLFLYYSYGADWRHPYFYSRETGWKSARPAYEEPDPAYKYEKPEDFTHYIEFAHAQLRELLTQYGPLAGIWLDPIMGYYSAPHMFPIEETYALIRSLQPQCLISFKQGASGDEDFAAPERKAGSLAERAGEVAAIAWEKNKHKPMEICDTLQPRTWGYNAAMDGKHKSAEEVMGMLAEAAKVPANLLLNTGPLPDGSIPEEDAKTLRDVGQRLRAMA